MEQKNLDSIARAYTTHAARARIAEGITCVFSLMGIGGIVLSIIDKIEISSADQVILGGVGITSVIANRLAAGTCHYEEAVAANLRSQSIIQQTN